MSSTSSNPVLYNILGELPSASPGNSNSTIIVKDVSLETVLYTAYMNSVLCVFLLLLFSYLRNKFPQIYFGRERHLPSRTPPRDPSTEGILFGWLNQSWGLGWPEIRNYCGLDTYMFLRYIRLCSRVTGVSAFWGIVLLWPVYSGGGGDEAGWYTLSMKNISVGSYKLWAPTIFMYFLTAYTVYMLVEEYKHYVELRMDYLARGDPSKLHDTHQTQHSILVENVPKALRSETALFNYFNCLFPGAVHSAALVLTVPDLESLVGRRTRILRRLEKAHTLYAATGQRPVHIMGRARCLCCGIESRPIIPWSKPWCCRPSRPRTDWWWSSERGKKGGATCEEEEGVAHSSSTNNGGAAGVGGGDTKSIRQAATGVNDISLDVTLGLAVPDELHCGRRAGCGFAAENAPDDNSASHPSGGGSAGAVRPPRRRGGAAAATCCGGLACCGDSEGDVEAQAAMEYGSRRGDVQRSPMNATRRDESDLDGDVAFFMEDDSGSVDSIAYYTRDLAAVNEEVAKLLTLKLTIASEGTGMTPRRPERQYDATAGAPATASTGGGASSAKAAGYNNTTTTTTTNNNNNNNNSADAAAAARGKKDVAPTAAAKSYGSLDNSMIPTSPLSATTGVYDTDDIFRSSLASPLVESDHLTSLTFSKDINTSSSGLKGIAKPNLIQPGGHDKDRGVVRRIVGKLGLDFFLAMMNLVRDNFVVVVVDSVTTTKTMSSTGFVTFKDLQSVASAISAPLTHVPATLDVKAAPEPGDIVWRNAHVSQPVLEAKQNSASVAIAFGALFWSTIVSGIQLFVKADNLASLDYMHWLTTFTSEQNMAYIDAYLPVLALLGLIQLLPIVFEWVAVLYENRKTKSDIQRSILKRYFFFQLANIYVTVTAGSLWDSLNEVVVKNEISKILQTLGQSIPTVVGYFISLIVTKILAGLPLVLLRIGPLFRLGFLRACFSKESLTQRELAELYKKQELMYGWEYPTQLLVIVICFTYACISPIILPVGFVYFSCALVVYKAQCLSVYTPEFESGGEIFPNVCHRTLFGLACAQVTLLAYLIIMEGWKQAPFILILPFWTYYMMRRLSVLYDKPAEMLSLERAVQIDREYARRRVDFAQGFDKYFYRQPVLDPKILRLSPQCEMHANVRSAGANSIASPLSRSITGMGCRSDDEFDA